MGAFDWSATAGPNASADPAIPAADGASSRVLPGLARGVMAGVAALAADQGGTLVTAGTSDAYTVSTTSGIRRLAAGLSLMVQADRDSVGTNPSFAPDGLAPQPFLDASGAAARVRRGRLYRMIFDPTRGWISDALPALGNGDLAAAPALTLKGNSTGQAGTPQDLTPAQVKSLLAYGIGDVSGLLLRLSGIDSAIGGKIDAVGFPALVNTAVAASQPGTTLYPALTRPLGSWLDDLLTIVPGFRALLATKLQAALASGVLRVACLGDSLTNGLITDGPTTSHQSYRAYPTALQSALTRWYPSAQVGNFGVPGQNIVQMKARFDAGLKVGGQPPDVLIVMGGTNDATGNPVALSAYETALLGILGSCIYQGIIPIVMTSPNTGAAATTNGVSLYSRAARQIADALNIACVSADLQFGWMPDRFGATYDAGLHYKDKAYNELGYHLAALFAPDSGGEYGPLAIGAGDVLSVDDLICFGGARNGNPSARTGYSVTLNQGQKLVLTLAPDADVVPLVNVIQPTPGEPHGLTMRYADGESGVANVVAIQDGTTVNRVFTGPVLNAGLRVFEIEATQNTINLDEVRFVARDRATFSCGGKARPVPLRGGLPAGVITAVGAPAARFAFDEPLRLPGRYIVRAKLRAAAPVHGFWLSTTPIMTTNALPDGMGVLRSGNDLIYRTQLNGAQSDITVGGAFTAGNAGAGDYDAWLRLDFTSIGGTPTLAAILGAYAAASAPLTFASTLFPGLIQYGDLDPFVTDWWVEDL